MITATCKRFAGIVIFFLVGETLGAQDWLVVKSVGDGSAFSVTLEDKLGRDVSYKFAACLWSLDGAEERVAVLNSVFRRGFVGSNAQVLLTPDGLPYDLQIELGGKSLRTGENTSWSALHFLAKNGAINVVVDKLPEGTPEWWILFHAALVKGEEGRSVDNSR